jgi:two-component system nitrogen regulation response regulator NtrX
VIPLRVPPLRERAEDVPALVAHFIALFAHEIKQRPKTVDRDALQRLKEYSWPGNVRELRNLVERMMIMVAGPSIGVADLSAAVRHGAGGGGSGGGDAGGGRALWETDFASLREARAAFEKHFIERKLAELDGNVSRTAQALGLERSNLYRKLRAYGIEVERNGAAAANAADADPADTAAPIIEP